MKKGQRKQREASEGESAEGQTEHCRAGKRERRWAAKHRQRKREDRAREEDKGEMEEARTERGREGRVRWRGREGERENRGYREQS